VTLLPELLDDLIGHCNPVRVIDAFVGRLDLTRLGSKVPNSRQRAILPTILATCCRFNIYGPHIGSSSAAASKADANGLSRCRTKSYHSG